VLPAWLAVWLDLRSSDADCRQSLAGVSGCSQACSVTTSCESGNTLRLRLPLPGFGACLGGTFFATQSYADVEGCPKDTDLRYRVWSRVCRVCRVCGEWDIGRWSCNSCRSAVARNAAPGGIKGRGRTVPRQIGWFVLPWPSARVGAARLDAVQLECGLRVAGEFDGVVAVSRVGRHTMALPATRAPNRQSWAVIPRSEIPT
jgi:hypothetical protein